MSDDLKPIAAAMSIVVLLAYVVTFAYFAVDSLSGSSGTGLESGPLSAPANEAVAYVWTSVSVLVGGIVAVAFGQEPPGTTRWPWWKWPTAQQLIKAYAWTWFVVGVTAIVVWAINAINPTLFRADPSDTPLLIKNAATAFLGLVAPIVTNFLRPPSRA